MEPPSRADVRPMTGVAKSGVVAARSEQSRIALRSIRATFCRGVRVSIHHDLHTIPWLDLGVLVEAVEDAEALGRAVDAGHAVGEGFDRIARLCRDDLDAQGTSGLDFFQRHATVGLHRTARIALTLSASLL